MKILIKIFILIIIPIVAYLLYPHAIDNNVLSTIYNVSGILFSVGMGLIITFNLNEIKNTDYIKIIRIRINIIRDKFIGFFTVMTILYISNYIIQNYNFKVLNININIFMQWFSLIFCLFTILYFTINFISVQHLKDEICDRLHSK